MLGPLQKMQVTQASPVEYAFRLGDAVVPVNPLLGQEISLRYTGEIHCVACGRRTNKSFAQGYCYPCFQTSPECSPCIIKPELCEAHHGNGRDMEWEREHHLSEQIVYLADTGGDIKVGVTRAANLPTRWIDQGATLAVRLALAVNRYHAGLVEVAMKAHIADKTNWRKMLSGSNHDAETLRATRARLAALFPATAEASLAADDSVTTITYPVSDYPVKIKSVGFDKHPLVSGTLMGIKGQYLIFDEGRVLNVRNHAGYVVELL